MSEPFLGEIRLVGFNFAPVGWALCAGQILPINQNTALFSLLGTTYGGNGTTTFALPDLRGRAAVGFGQGPGLSNYDLGQSTGTETVTLTVGHIAAHSHLVAANAASATVLSPGGADLAQTFYSGPKKSFNTYSTPPITAPPWRCCRKGMP